MITVLVEPRDFAADEVRVEGDSYRHLFRASRAAVGDRLRVVDGAGGARWAQVAAVDRRSARLALGAAAPANEPSRRVELFVAPPRPQRASWLIEKATELGVSAIRFVAFERVVRPVGENQLARFGRVAVAALEQCGRSRLPLLSGSHPREELPSLLEPLAERRVLVPEGEPFALPPAGGVALVIGPEGGLTAAEVEGLVGQGCRPASLGSRILRLETAALAAAALALAPHLPEAGAPPR